MPKLQDDLAIAVTFLLTGAMPPAETPEEAAEHRAALDRIKRHAAHCCEQCDNWEDPDTNEISDEVYVPCPYEAKKKAG